MKRVKTTCFKFFFFFCCEHCCQKPVHIHVCHYLPCQHSVKSLSSLCNRQRRGPWKGSGGRSATSSLPRRVARKRRCMLMDWKTGEITGQSVSVWLNLCDSSTAVASQGVYCILQLSKVNMTTVIRIFSLSQCLNRFCQALPMSWNNTCCDFMLCTHLIKILRSKVKFEKKKEMGVTQKKTVWDI